MDISGLPTASTIDPVQDIFPIVTTNINTTGKINRNTFLGLASAPIGITDTQTITNKTLTNPTINAATLSGTLSGTYTLGGTPTFPSSVVTLIGTQTLTNKTLTSPTINSPTITNATLTADALAGFTTANSGIAYGISISGGVVTTANSVNGSALTNGSVTQAKLSLTGGVNTYTNSGSAGGTGYYINLGGIKYAWGMTGTLSLSATSTGTGVINFPSSFFTTVQSFICTPTGGVPAGTVLWGISSQTTPTITNVTINYFYTAGTSVTGSIVGSWFVVGT